MIHARVLSAIQAALGVIEAFTGLMGVATAVLSVTACTGLMGFASQDSGDGVLPGLAVGGIFGMALSLVFLLPALALFLMAALRGATVWYLRNDQPNSGTSTVLGVAHILGPLLLAGWLFLGSPLLGVMLLPVGIVWVGVSVWAGVELIRSASSPTPGPRIPGAG